MIKNLALLVCSIAIGHSTSILAPQHVLAMPVNNEVLVRVKTQADLVKWQDRRVQIMGRYVATSKGKPTKANANVVNPMTGEPVFQGSYTTVAIELADGTRVPLYSPLLKQSNRPPREVQTFDGKMVIVVGKIAQVAVSTGNNPESKMAIVSMERIELERERSPK